MRLLQKMFQPHNTRLGNMISVNVDGQFLNLYQRPSRALPMEIQYSDDVPQRIDVNPNRRHIFQPPLLQLSNGVSRINSRPNRDSYTAGSSRHQVENMAVPGPSHQVLPTAANLNSSNVSVSTSTDSRRRHDNIPLATRETKEPQENVPLLANPTNNSLVKHNSIASNSTSTTQNLSHANTASNLNTRVFGSTDDEKFFVFTGTVERVIKWNKIFQNQFCFFEVMASVISIQEGTVRSQKIMLLRDKKGPILQVVYYNTTTHMDIEDFHVGQILRCVGKMTVPNILNAVSIRSATQEEIETLQRLCLVCDHAVSHFLNA